MSEKEGEKKIIKKSNTNNNLVKKISITLLITLIIISIINVMQVTSFSTSFNNLIDRSIEEQKPAQISLTIINPNCSDCFNVNEFVDKISSSRKTNITSTTKLSLENSQAQKLIQEYNIEKFPAVIVKGNVNKSSSLLNTLSSIGANKVNSTTFYAQAQKPLYTNKNGEIIGWVSIIALDNKECIVCDKSDSYISQLENIRVKISDIKSYDINSQQGEEIIKKYNINKVPNIIFSKELGLYPQFSVGWSQAGTIEEDGSYVLRNIRYPYYSLDENKLIGSLNFTYIYDSNCRDCFNATKVYDAIFSQFGVMATYKDYNDIAKDKSLIEKYNIDKVPALIIRGDTEKYEIFRNWYQLGTIEENNSTYVFRNVDLLQLKFENLN